MLSTQPYKGARDFYPEDKRLQKYIFAVMRKVAESFGYEEYDAPILEPLDLYAAKSGQEIVNEQTYAFEDRGGRIVTLRPEMTPSVSRMVAAKPQEHAFPLRWYSIPNLWRYERPQRGRLREHWQLNVDIFGLETLEADHEIIHLADSIMQAYGAKRTDYTIKVNSRKLIDFIMSDVLRLHEVQSDTLMKLMDRREKMDPALFLAEIDAIFTPSQRDLGSSSQLIELLKVKDLEGLPLSLRSHKSVTDLEELVAMLNRSGVTNVVFDLNLMRGFDYYTDIVFEIFDTYSANNRSLFGGGRYDGLVGLFGVDPVPTVGFGMGDVTLQNFLESHELLPKLKPETDVYAILIGDIYFRAQKTIDELREMGLKVAVDMTGRKTSQQIKTAVKKGIHYALFIGENELNSGQLVLRDLETSQEERHSPQRIVSIVKDYRRK